MDTERIMGLTLLGAGTLMIVIAIIGACAVFAGSTNPPGIFDIQRIAITVPTGSGVAIQPIELLSGKMASKFVDMAVWYLLMLFVLSAGAKIAGIGVQLLREIKIVVKAKDQTSSFTV